MAMPCSVFFLLLSVAMSVSTLVAAHANDEAALLAFKAAAAGGRSDALASWNSTTTDGWGWGVGAHTVEWCR